MTQTKNRGLVNHSARESSLLLSVCIQYCCIPDGGDGCEGGRQKLAVVVARHAVPIQRGAANNGAVTAPLFAAPWGIKFTR